MFRQLRLSNFKAFGDPQVVPLAPITLIFGPNSAGKSSIIQSLLLLSQSVSEGPFGADRLLFSGEQVDLGTCLSAIHRHDPALRMQLGFSFSPPRARSRQGPERLHLDNIRNIDIEVSITGNGRDEHADASISRVTYSLDQNTNPISLVTSDSSGEPSDLGPRLFNFADNEAAQNFVRLLDVHSTARREQPERSRIHRAGEIAEIAVRATTIRALRKQAFFAVGFLPARFALREPAEVRKLESAVGEKLSSEPGAGQFNTLRRGSVISK